MKEDVLIRMGEDKDLEEVLFLDNKIFPQNKVSRNKLKKRVENNLVVVAEIGSEIAAFSFYKPQNKNSWLMGKVAVSEKHRRKGVGTKLFDFVLKRARQNGINKLIYRVRRDNKKAIKMYKRRGAIIAKEIKSFYRDGQSAYQMEEKI